MREEIERTLFDLLGDVPGTSKVGGGPVPLPSSSGGMSDHLFVNLTLGGLDQSDDAFHLLDRLRDIAFDVFVRLRQGVDVRGYATICLSLFMPISDTEGLRIYRTRVKTQDLSRLSRENFKQVVTGEESGKPDVHRLLRIQEP